MPKRIPKNLLRAWEFKKKNQQFEEQLKQQQQQQQRSIKKLPRRIKNKKCYFITEDSEDYDENIDDCENENDD